MTVVDASVWVSWFVTQDARHAQSRHCLMARTASGHPLVAPTLMLSEVAGPVARRTRDPLLARQAVSHLLRVPTLRLVTIDQPLARAAAGLAADFGLPGADAVYVALAQMLGLPLLTWDRELLRRGSQVVQTRTP